MKLTIKNQPQVTQISHGSQICLAIKNSLTESLEAFNAGIENLMKIISTVAEDTNVFIISHKSELEDVAFARKIEFVKEKNFSKIKS